MKKNILLILTIIITFLFSNCKKQDCPEGMHKEKINTGTGTTEVCVPD